MQAGLTGWTPSLNDPLKIDPSLKIHRPVTMPPSDHSPTIWHPTDLKW
jgi:hypothetical protein